MKAENLHIASWKIENFSSWNQALHGKCIESPLICFAEPNLEMKLYPRGTSGQEERMVVYLSINHMEGDFSGDLSFIGADGSTFFTQRVNCKEGDSNLELTPGPKFEEVIVQIGENKSDHKDQLILRLQIDSDDYDEYNLCTIIQVFDVTLEVVDSNMILEEDDKMISYIRYTHDNYDADVYFRTRQIREDKKVELYLDPNTAEKFSVKTHLSLMNSVGSLIRYENNEHVFHKKQAWTFSESLTKRELLENVISIILHLKIISGKVHHTLQNVYLYYDNVKILPNRNISNCTDKSSNTHDAVACNDQENAVGVLSKQLMCLYQDQDFSDLQLKCESVSFLVHRNILSARSPVFKTMLSSDMKEAASGCVDIADLDAPILARFFPLHRGCGRLAGGERPQALLYSRQVPGPLSQEGMRQFPEGQRLHFERL